MKRIRTILLILVLLVGLAVIAHRPILNAMGRFLVVQDPLDRADVIVVLAGELRDERVRQAAELYHQGYASRLLLSGSEEMAGISVTEIQRSQAVAFGVPDSVLLYETDSTSTHDQARNVRPILERLGARRAIVVTSSVHTRRTRYIFRKVFEGSSVEIRVYPVQRDLWSPVEWWTRDQDTELLVLEYIKLGLALFR